MTEEKKIAAFEAMLRLEHLEETETFSGHNYVEQSNGAFAVLQALGIDREYIHWSEGK